MSKIRQARVEDFDAINHLSQYFGYPRQGDDVAFAGFKSVLESDNDWIWVFVQQGQVLGWIHIFTARRLASSTFNEIGGMVVSVDHRHQGIGRQLVERVRIWSQDHELSLRVRCNSKREETLEFYQSIGFSELKTQTVFEKGG